MGIDDINSIKKIKEAEASTMKKIGVMCHPNLDAIKIFWLGVLGRAKFCTVTKYS